MYEYPLIPQLLHNGSGDFVGVNVGVTEGVGVNVLVTVGVGVGVAHIIDILVLQLLQLPSFCKTLVAEY